MKLRQGDKWLIEEISEGLSKRFGISEKEAEKMVFRSNFMQMLEEFPEQVHHDTPNSWVNSIARQMKLREMAY
jgi:hypothetical protein